MAIVRTNALTTLAHFNDGDIALARPLLVEMGRLVMGESADDDQQGSLLPRRRGLQLSQRQPDK
jgi:hypothetical protein